MDFSERFVFGKNKKVVMASISKIMDIEKAIPYIEEFEKSKEETGLSYKMFYNDDGTSALFLFSVEETDNIYYFGDSSVHLNKRYNAVILDIGEPNYSYAFYHKFSSSYMTISYINGVLKLGSVFTLDLKNSPTKYSNQNKVNSQRMEIVNQDICTDDDDDDDYDDEDDAPYYSGDDDDDDDENGW